MRRAPRRLRRSRSISSPRVRRRARGVLAVAALLIGALLAWALPALAGPHHDAPARSHSVRAAAATARPAVSHTLPDRARVDVRPAAARAAARAPHAVAAPASWVGSWSRPATVFGPVSADLMAPVIGVSASGMVTVGSGQTDEDAPADARTAVISGGAGGTFGTAEKLGTTQQTLAVAYLGKRPVLLTGTSPLDDACCSSVATRVSDGSSFGTPLTLTGGLEGTTVGTLVPVHGGLLAAVDNQAGITVARSSSSGAFVNSEQLAPSDPTPPLMAAGPLSDGGVVVAWTAPATGAQTVTGTTTAPGSSRTTSGYDQPENQLIAFATAGASGLPGAPHLAVTVPSGREIDALAVAPHRSGATVAWTESWYAGTRYLSEVFWTDLSGGTAGRVHQLSAAGSVAVGVSLAGSSAGREVLAWQACEIGAGTCETEAALRPHGGAWGPVRSLGAVDPTSFPVAAESSLGQSLVGWIADGAVQARAARPGASDFYRSVRVSAAGAAASDLALSFGGGEKAAAVWVQGTVDQKLVDAGFTP